MSHHSSTIVTIILPALFLAAFLAAPLAGASSTSRVLFAETDMVASVYFAAKSAASDPFLTLDATESRSTTFNAVTTPTAGAQRFAETLQGAKPQQVAEFVLTKPLDRTYWFNLSKSLAGIIHFQTSVSKAATSDYASIRVEFYAGDVLIGGDTLHVAAASLKALNLKFRPETDKLEQGTVLKARILTYYTSSDLTIGTGGTMQSVLEFAYFDTDPLAGALYVENRKQQFIGPATEAGFGLAAPLGLLVPRRRRAAALVALAVFAVGFAGCMGGGPGGASATDPTSQTIETTGVEDPTLRAKGHGAVEGLVKDGDRFGAPLSKVHISLIGTTLFAETDVGGRFAFPNVTAGEYRLRADKQGFVSVEASFVVHVGVRTQINLTLSSGAIAQGANQRPHLHDEWGGETTKTLLEETVLPPSYAGDFRAQNKYLGSFYSSEGVRIPIPDGRLVLPGATRIDVRFDWTADATSDAEFALRILTPTDKAYDQLYVPRGSGKAFHIAIFPLEADSGHQKRTEWEFHIVRPQRASYYFYDAPQKPVTFGGPIRVKIEIFKGVVPYEPFHPDFWKGLNEVTVFKDSSKTVGTSTSGCFVTNYCLAHEALGGDWPNGNFWIPGKDVFVPPGTKTIKGAFSYTFANAETTGTTFTLVYQSADMYHSYDPYIQDDTWAKIPLTPKGTNAFEFSLDLKPEQTDQFYQKASKWRLSPNNEGDDALEPYLEYSYPGGTTFKLTLVAIKDPNFKDA